MMAFIMLHESVNTILLTSYNIEHVYMFNI